jgi:hypothetical protein
MVPRVSTERVNELRDQWREEDGKQKAFTPVKTANEGKSHYAPESAHAVRLAPSFSLTEKLIRVTSLRANHDEHS